MFYRFYVLQILVFSSGLARTTAIGYVMYRLGATPQQLGLTTSISLLGMLSGYFSIPYLRRDDLFLSAQRASLVLYGVMLFYTAYIIYAGHWGNFWIWTALSTMSSFIISVDQAARPLYIKTRFANTNYASIMKRDVLTLGVAKVLGFATGIFIVSKWWIVLIFLIGAAITYSMCRYASVLEKVGVVQTAENHTFKEFSYKTTVALHMLSFFLLFPINTQAVTYSKIWDIAFYWFLISSSLGNIVFNLCFSHSLELRKSFILYVVCLIAGLGLFLMPGYWVLLGSFMVGGVYASFTAISSARLYESGLATKYISRFYIAGSVVCIVGSYLLGALLENYSKNTVFILLMCTAALYLVLAYYSTRFTSK